MHSRHDRGVPLRVLLALQWPDVDFDNHAIRIDESISLTESGEAIVGDTKTEDSADWVDMPEWYMDELKAFSS